MELASIEDYADDSITRAIIGSAITVHRVLGPGLLESAYQTCLAHQLVKDGLGVEREVPLPVEYDGIRLDCGYRIDLVVARAVIVEVKAVEAILPVHEAQLLSYLRLAGVPRGLLINFHVSLLKDGIRRRVLTRAIHTSSNPSSSAPSATRR